MNITEKLVTDASWLAIFMFKRYVNVVNYNIIKGRSIYCRREIRRCFVQSVGIN